MDAATKRYQNLLREMDSNLNEMHKMVNWTLDSIREEDAQFKDHQVDLLSTVSRRITDSVVSMEEIIGQ